MADDNWDAVSDALRNRVAELGITQKELSARSGVSESTIRQLQNNYGPRRRNRRTLEDLSRGLSWPDDHLGNVLDGAATESAGSATATLRALVEEMRDDIAELRKRVEALERGTR